MAPRKKILTEEITILPENDVTQKKSVEFVDEQEFDLKTNTESSVQQIVSEQGKFEEPMIEPELSNSRTDRGALILGGGLLLMGIVLLLGRILSFPFGDFMWPFIFIIPGVLVFFSAVASDSSSGEGLSILGAILTSLGLIFLTQQVTGLWASWAYVWALIAPTSIGVAQVVYGTRKNRDLIIQSGKKLINIGLILFAIGFVFFELIIGINGFGIGNLGLPVIPVMMVFVGVVILARALIKNR